MQFYGWAFLNRAALLPTREQVDRAREIATAAKARLAGTIDIFYVLPDYYETRPKPCLNGWGQRYLTVNPIGDVLPCPTASSAIPDLRFENVRERDLDWIWRESESFNRFRGTEWMPEPCRSCPQKEIDFGGCRCQAALLTGNAANTDPVCEFSPNRTLVDAVLRDINSSSDYAPEWTYRLNPYDVVSFRVSLRLGCALLSRVLEKAVHPRWNRVVLTRWQNECGLTASTSRAAMTLGAGPV